MDQVSAAINGFFRDAFRSSKEGETREIMIFVLIFGGSWIIQEV
jgi:hypothetical protein